MNKKIITILAVFTIFLAIGTVNAGFLDFLGTSDSSANNDNNTFVVGFCSEFPPFAYRTDNGSYTGFDLALAEEVCARNNWTFKAQPIINWDSKKVEVDSGEIDCIWSEFTINGRENDYEWSDPYFNNTQVFVVKSDSNISSIGDLKGKTVEVLGESSGADALKTGNKTIADTFGKTNEIKDYNTAFMDLDSGACDAVLVDVGSANYQMTGKFNSTGFKIINEPLTYEQYGVGFKKGNTELRDQVQKTIDEMFKDGTIDKIAQNYSDYEIPQNLIRP